MRVNKIHQVVNVNIYSCCRITLSRASYTFTGKVYKSEMSIMYGLFEKKNYTFGKNIHQNPNAYSCIMISCI